MFHEWAWLQRINTPTTQLMARRLQTLPSAEFVGSVGLRVCDPGTVGDIVLLLMIWAKNKLQSFVHSFLYTCRLKPVSQTRPTVCPSVRTPVSLSAPPKACAKSRFFCNFHFVFPFARKQNEKRFCGSTLSNEVKYDEITMQQQKIQCKCIYTAIRVYMENIIQDPHLRLLKGFFKSR